MITDPQRAVRWKLGVLAGLAVVLISFIPEAIHWANRGTDWNGTYACVDPDEMAYSAYLDSIIKGGPRRNNPYTAGQINRNPGNESLFSIQFVPPYAVGFLARVFGISASTIFILLIPICAFSSSMAVFWLLSLLTNNDVVSGVGVLVVLLCAVLVSENLLAAEQPYYTFAFLRRYIPAVAFPVVFLFCVFVWRALTSNLRVVWAWSALAGLAFVFLVYSYFYLWTAAAAWLALISVTWFMLRYRDRNQLIITLAIIGLMAAGALFPYFQLLDRRADTLDNAVALVFTHRPDLFRFAEILSLVLLCVWGIYSRRAKIEWETPAAIFAVSFLLTPFLVFNQQVLTGRSLQPFHYEQFIVNYFVLVGAIVVYYLIRKREPRRPVIVSAIALGVGLAVALASSVVTAPMNEQRDEAISIYENLQEEVSRKNGVATTLFDQPLLAVSAATSHEIPVLWSPYMYTFGTTTAQEETERFFQYLYFLGVDESQFAAELRKDRLYQATLFGLPRVNKKLSTHFQPISDEEIRYQTRAYSAYVRGFSQEEAMRWPLSFVALEDRRTYDLSNLDRWYERGMGYRTGRAIVYRVKLRTESKQSA